MKICMGTLTKCTGKQGALNSIANYLCNRITLVVNLEDIV